MSYVEILILRRLHGGPAHGYELRKRVEETTGFVLHNNSLYPALRRFEEAGAVTKAAEPQQGRLLRLVYTLTDVGREPAARHAGRAAGRAGWSTRGVHGPSRSVSLVLNSAERAGVLAARARSVRTQLAHYEVMHKLAVDHGERWGARATAEPDPPPPAGADLARRAG